ncbi:hypothetical protein LTR28_004689 [Elasticomyces elasticus]|nr:hypothetical protein LTR28_004689 [Elasticomyces elasticus]
MPNGTELVAVPLSVVEGAKTMLVGWMVSGPFGRDVTREVDVVVPVTDTGLVWGMVPVPGGDFDKPGVLLAFEMLSTLDGPGATKDDDLPEYAPVTDDSKFELEDVEPLDVAGDSVPKLEDAVVTPPNPDERVAVALPSDTLAELVAMIVGELLFDVDAVVTGTTDGAPVADTLAGVAEEVPVADMPESRLVVFVPLGDPEVTVAPLERGIDVEVADAAAVVSKLAAPPAVADTSLLVDLVTERLSGRGVPDVVAIGDAGPDVTELMLAPLPAVSLFVAVEAAILEGLTVLVGAPGVVVGPDVAGTAVAEAYDALSEDTTDASDAEIEL